MTLEVRWSRRASRDLVRMHDFLAADNLAAARRATETIQKAVELVTEYPATGKTLGSGENIYEWFAEFGRGAFVIRYRLKPKHYLAIIRVWHSREARN